MKYSLKRKLSPFLSLALSLAFTSVCQINASAGESEETPATAAAEEVLS